MGLAEARLDLWQDLDLALLEQEKSLRDQLNRKAIEKTTLLNGKTTSAQLKSVDEAILSLKNELIYYENKLRAGVFKVASRAGTIHAPGDKVSTKGNFA